MVSSTKDDVDTIARAHFDARDPLQKAYVRMSSIITNCETFRIKEPKSKPDYEMLVVNSFLSITGRGSVGAAYFAELIDSSKRQIRKLADIEAMPFPIALQCHKHLDRIHEIIQKMSDHYSQHETFHGDFMTECQKMLLNSNSMVEVLHLVDDCINYCALDNLEEAFEFLKKLERAGQRMEEQAIKAHFMKPLRSSREIKDLQNHIQDLIWEERPASKT